VLNAHGGRDRWGGKKAFSAHVSISGALLPPPDGHPLPVAPRNRPTARELVVEGETRLPRLKIFGCTDVTRYGVYTPRRVEVRSLSDQLLEALDDPMEALASRPPDRPLSQIERLFIFGAILWSAITGPFLLDTPGVSVKEKPGRLLKVAFPAAIEPLAPKRVLHVAKDGLIERHDYELKYLYPSPLTDTASAHIVFNGIVVPTLRRVFPLKAGTDRSPALLDIEIFDIRFS